MKSILLYSATAVKYSEMTLNTNFREKSINVMLSY